MELYLEKILTGILPNCSQAGDVRQTDTSKEIVDNVEYSRIGHGTSAAQHYSALLTGRTVADNDTAVDYSVRHIIGAYNPVIELYRT